MDALTTLHITAKGEAEVKHRTHKLSMKKRSVLILLDKPKTLEQLLSKTVLHPDETLGEIEALMRDGFVDAWGSIPDAETVPAKNAPPLPNGSPVYLSPEIVISEAKFLLTDFAVDTFGTQSQTIADQIRDCKTVHDVESCLTGILALAEKQCPARLPALRVIVGEINATA